jgi:hypothetical protein
LEVDYMRWEARTGDECNPKNECGIFESDPFSVPDSFVLCEDWKSLMISLTDFTVVIRLSTGFSFKEGKACGIPSFHG